MERTITHDGEELHQGSNCLDVVHCLVSALGLWGRVWVAAWGRVGGRRSGLPSSDVVSCLGCSALSRVPEVLASDEVGTREVVWYSIIVGNTTVYPPSTEKVVDCQEDLSQERILLVEWMERQWGCY